MTLDRNCLDISLAFATHKSFQQCSSFVEPVQLLYFFGANPTVVTAGTVWLYCTLVTV